MDIHQLLEATVKAKASDLHLMVGKAPTVRVHGELEIVKDTSPLRPEDTSTLVYSLLSPEQKALFLANRELDFSYAISTGRFRVNIYFERGTVAAALRLIPNVIRTIDDLGLPKILHEFAKLRQGFVLVTGPTGHGKSTTLAALINEINQNRGVHIVTIEDPIEYVYPLGKSLISQREMHVDTHSWTFALRSVLREDPDVVLVGEMRDYDTIAAALTIAETGHLVFATLHTNSAAQTIDRIVDVFPPVQQNQIKLQLSATLAGILSQRLVPAIGGGRVPVTEVLLASSATKNAIREGKTHLLDNIILTSREQGMMLFETSLANYVFHGRISSEVAMAYAVRPVEFDRLLVEQGKQSQTRF